MPPAPPRQAPVLSVGVRTFKEPDDYAHRNYCAAGAAAVLLSAWTEPTVDVEAIARAIALDPRTGATGAATATGVNTLLAPVVRPVLGRDRYHGDHVASVSVLEQILRTDLGDARAVSAFGHAVPVMVQTMTRTMPGWSGWQATHVITIFAADLRSHDPARDTVTYAETPSPIAGYAGPPRQTTSVAALWVAMQAFLKDDPADPVNVVW